MKNTKFKPQYEELVDLARLSGVLEEKLSFAEFCGLPTELYSLSKVAGYVGELTKRIEVMEHLLDASGDSLYSRISKDIDALFERYNLLTDRINEKDEEAKASSKQKSAKPKTNNK